MKFKLSTLLLIFSFNVLAAGQYCTVLLNDLHLNPTLSRQMPFEPEGRGSDLDSKSYTVFMKALEHTETYKHADSMMLLGDLVGHRLSNAKRAQVIHDVYLDLYTMHKPAYIAFGNNDSLQGNYQSYEGKNGSPYQIGQSIWGSTHSGFSTATNLTGCDTSSSKTYPCIRDEQTKDGHYSITLKPGLRLLSLNSVLFNGDYFFNYQDTAEEALAWFNAQLEQSQKHHEQVLITLHVPPVLNLYSKQYHFRDKQTHQPTFQQAFMKILKRAVVDDNLKVLAILGAHTHYDETHILKLDKHKVPVILSPALSTGHGNAVGFKTLCLDNQHNQWRINHIDAFKFNPQVEQFEQYSSTNALQFAELLKSPKQLLAHVKRYYFANNPNQQNKAHFDASDLIKEQ